MTFEEWLKFRTFSHAQFRDLRSLLQKKTAQHISVSLCLPTLNEAATIGQIIRILKGPLQDQVPLIDEIFVIDSGSGDGTQEIARKMGVPVYQSDDILPEVEPVRGKGENLWKSLQVANGDIILWIDTDIRNMNPRFVTGLLGPLLFHREISFVKGYYRRPIQIGNELCSTGGGRVTEILVKPFFNLLFPELALFHQPLSGEYGGRRELLERVPFFTGYGVETGLLIDIEQRFGLNCMAQVDLNVRVHRNQDLVSLRKMAFGILQVLLIRAEQQGKLVLMNNLQRKMLTIFRDEFNQYDINLKEVQDTERVPIISLEGYQKKRSLGEEELILVNEARKQKNYPPVMIGPLLDADLIQLNGTAADKQQTLDEISRMFTENGHAGDRRKLITDFRKREKILSTAIGEGIAIPHVISSSIPAIKIVIYRAAQGIIFDAPDGKPVRLIVAVICPNSRRQQYLEILANLSGIFRIKDFRSQLMDSASPGEFISILRKIEFVNKYQKELQALEA